METKCLTCGKPISEIYTKCKECYMKENNISLRKCERCGELKIPAYQPEWKKTCFACYEKTKDQNYRKCENCQELKIPIGRPKWQKVCSKCFNAKK